MSHKQAKWQRQQLKRERREIQVRLAEQLRLLEKRCRDFDEGDWEEAVDIATRLRVIFHPGSKTKRPSILQSIDAEKVPILSSIEHRDHANGILSMSGGLYRQTFGKNENGPYYELRTIFGDSFYKSEVPADQWWNAVAEVKGDEVGNPGRYVYRRVDVVKGIAEHDGGAHLANQLPESHGVLTRPGGLEKITNGKEVNAQIIPVVGVHLAMLRQIAYEVLNSPALIKLSNPEKKKLP